MTAVEPSTDSPFNQIRQLGRSSANPGPKRRTASLTTSSTVVPGTSVDPTPAISRARANSRREATSPSVPAVPWTFVTSNARHPGTRVLVLRHGQSTWNALRKWQGQADPPLSDLGRAQARSAAGLLANECPVFDAVVTSDLERARVTGESIADIIGCPRVSTDVRWRENHAGEWQGLTPDEINRDWPGYLADNRRPPNFESEESTIERTMAALSDIATAHPDGCVLVISHGGVLRLLRRHFGDPDTRFPNLAGGWFEHGPDATWRNGSLLFPLELIADELRNTGAVE